MKIVVDLHSRSLIVTVEADFTALSGKRFLSTVFMIIGTLSNDAYFPKQAMSFITVDAIIGN